MTEQGKDTRFDLAWVLGGAVIMFCTNFGGGIIAGLMDVRDMWTIAILALICFALGGYIIGKKSAGQTILEAGLAAVLVLVVTIILRGMEFPDDPIALLLGFGAPFCAALFGGWLGERAQG